MAENIGRLFEALSQVRIMTPKDVNTIYNLLSQIYNILYSEMNKDIQKKHNKLERETREEMIKRNKGIKETFFVVKSNTWERELRAFAKEKQKEEEFTPGAV